MACELQFVSFNQDCSEQTHRRMRQVGLGVKSQSYVMSDDSVGQSIME
jgi:hypothetical protein